MTRVCNTCHENFEAVPHFWDNGQAMVAPAKNCKDCINNKAKIRWQRIKNNPDYLERERARKREYMKRRITA